MVCHITYDIHYLMIRDRLDYTHTCIIILVPYLKEGDMLVANNYSMRKLQTQTLLHPQLVPSKEAA